MASHKDLTLTNIHRPYAWTYADQTAREAATGFVAADVGKLSLQEDTNFLYMLITTAPLWQLVGAPIPIGGDEGQVLAKASNDDYDLEWVAQSGGGTGALPHTTILPFAYESKVGTYERLNYYLFYNTSNSVNDYLEFDTYLGTGTYTFILSYSKSSNGGILDVKLDGTNILTSVDCYGSASENKATATGVSVASGGFGKKIRIIVTGKNASSTAYYSFWSSLAIIQTG